ncbi:hypothetical protein KOW79_002762 [Hemibagrus wyckioides]|uniref:Fibronectin type-III domain-containing protein n=1 Tax=Hemibagrus wyckioides TaxID=337641 RepID=A0A9D3STD3_9TELE|nr:interferon gamma receptor 1-like [Hemibagrus wyckioides]KAG7334355.1 hypothetical protein KOW79_002762 [Hemibagrus wyckioides]
MAKPPTINFILGLYVCLNLSFSVALSNVPVLTNISLTCHNFKNVLYWNYSAPELKPEFNITISGYESEGTSVRTNQTYLDISKYTQDAGDSYNIQVATQANGSELSSEDFKFSYSENLITDITCVVDFPKLDVSVFDRRVKLSFAHPYNFYNLECLKGEFLWQIFYNKTERECGPCFEDDDVCTEEFQLSENIYGKCMNINIKGSVEGIPAEITRQVCDHQAPNNTDWIVLLTVLLCVGFGLLLLITSGVIMYRKLTKADSQSTLSKLLGIVRSDHVNVPEQPALSKVTSVGHTPLLETPDPFFTDTSIFKCEDGSDLPTHFPTNINPDITYSEEQEQEDGEEEADSEDFDSGNSFSGYDSHKFPIDMGQGDIVEAYGPR